jgi:hypothetical protein
MFDLIKLCRSKVKGKRFTNFQISFDSRRQASHRSRVQRRHVRDARPDRDAE